MEEALKRFLSRADIGIILITQDYADMARHVIEGHKAPIPTILEIPSKDSPYDPNKDSLLKRARYTNTSIIVVGPYFNIIYPITYTLIFAFFKISIFLKKTFSDINRFKKEEL